MVLDLCIFLSWFRQDNFFTGERNIMYWFTHFFVMVSNGLKLKSSWWICFLQTHSLCFTRWYLMDWITCDYIVVWITCRLLWCFYQLFGLSFWRHPFTASDVTTHFSKYSPMKQIHLYLGWPEGEYIFSKSSFLGELFLRNSYTDITLNKHIPLKAVYFYIESPLTVCLTNGEKVYLV